MTTKNLKYNTAIAAMMAIFNDFYKTGSITKGEFKTSDHPAQSGCTSYHRGNVAGNWVEGRVYQQTWPEYDEAKTVESSVEIAVQINGK